MPLNYFERVRIITLATDGLSHRQISRNLGIPKSTVSFVLKKWRDHGNIDRRRGSGGRRVSEIENDEALLNEVRNDPFTSAVQAAYVSNFPGSVRTARRRIKANGLNSYVAARKTRLTPHHKEARVAFALEHLAKNEEFWSSIIFSDEKVFQSCPNGRLRVYRPRNSRFHERYIQPVERSGRFSANFWAWISAGSPGVMVHVADRLNSNVYIRILENVMVPSVQPLFPDQNFIFQQDNCAVHTAHRVMEWFEDHNINVLDWPSRSPDLNPIENMWGLIVKNLERQRLVFHNRDELLTAVTEAWHTLPRDYHRNLCLSMPSRLMRVIEANGAMTKY